MKGFSAGCEMRAGPPSGNLDEEDTLATKRVSPERQLSQLDISYATDVAEQPGSSYQPGQRIPRESGRTYWTDLDAGRAPYSQTEPTKDISMNTLAGKVAVVTGASKGIGAGIAKGLGAAGAAVVVNYASSKEGADRVVAEITSQGGKAIAVQGDVSKAADVKRLFEETRKVFGSLDVLVNNAGVYDLRPLEEVTETEFHREFNTNVLGLILATQEAVKHFGAEGGSVINVGSGASELTPPTTVVYTATKGAVDAITGVLAKELGPKKIRVNSINPGVVETEGSHETGFFGSDLETQLLSETPLGRLGQPADIAPVAVFLASEDSEWLTGDILLASGGLR
jgi:3-oxoacyl-[acyl-carrier protein] reductase